jgi:hypothetical protein
MMDGLRLVALFGIVLWMLPSIWPDGRSDGADAVPMSQALFYVFGVWGALIVLSGLFSGVALEGDGVESQDETEREK